MKFRSVLISSLTDPSELERLRTDALKRLSNLASEYREDAMKLGVQLQVNQLTEVFLYAVREIPFPEEVVLTTNDMVGGLLSHLARKRSVDDQIQDRINKLTMRYEKWWGTYDPQISAALAEFQGTLIDVI